MLKFLRRYQAWILVIGTSLLMVAFLAPQAIQRLGPALARRGSVATIVVNERTRKIKPAEQFQAQAELAMIRDVFPGLIDALLDPEANSPLRVQQEDDAAGAAFAGFDHWILLKLEAELAGLMGGREDGVIYLQTRAAIDSQFLRIAPEILLARYETLIRDAAIGRQMTISDGYDALAKFVGVQRLVFQYRRAGITSQQRLLDLAEMFSHRVTVGVLFIDAAEFIDDLEAPTEDEMLAHFAQYRGDEPGSGVYGLGYHQPDRVQIEYLTVDYQSIVDQIQVDSLSARDWYEINKNNSEKVPQPRISPQPLPYDDVKADAIEAFRRDLAEQKVQQIIASVKKRLFRSMRSIQRQDDTYTLPADWSQRRVSFETLRQEIQDEYDATVNYHAEGAWLDQAELSGLPGGIGSASRLAGSTEVRLVQLVASTYELGNPQIPGIQVGVADPEPLREESTALNFGTAIRYKSNLHFFRIVGADRARPAKSLDEVRQEVERDAKRLRAYRQLEQQADVWAQRAIEVDLDALAEERETQVRTPRVSLYDQFAFLTAREFKPTSIGSAGPNKQLAEAIFAKVADFDPLARLEDFDLARRIITMPIPEKLGLAIVRLDANSPLTVEGYLALMTRGMFFLGQRLSMEDVYHEHEIGAESASPFSFDQLSARYQYVVEQGRKGGSAAADAGLGDLPGATTQPDVADSDPPQG